MLCVTNKARAIAPFFVIIGNEGHPVGRKKSGVRRYRVLRPIDDAKYAMIDLEFDTASDAEALLAAMRVVWGRVEGKVMTNPKARIVEAVETKHY